MNRGIAMRRTGGPEVLEWIVLPDEAPALGEILIRQTAVGLNFVDVYHRTGAYPMILPAVPGIEAAGIIEAVGEGVESLHVGDRIAYTMLPGAYRERRTIAADRAILLPDDIDDQAAVALLSKGLTARYLLHDIRAVRSGDIILVHAAAGGVGSLLCQWASSLGAVVIGVVSSDAKADLACQNGCDEVIVGAYADLPARIGKKIDIVFDSIGRDSFMASLDCLRPRGLMVCFGETSGPVEPFSLEMLQHKGSPLVTRPTLFDFIRTPQELSEASTDLFAAVRNGVIRPNVNQTYPLHEAAAAHRDMETRQTTGATVLEVAES